MQSHVLWSLNQGQRSETCYINRDIYNVVIIITCCVVSLYCTFQQACFDQSN